MMLGVDVATAAQASAVAPSAEVSNDYLGDRNTSAIGGGDGVDLGGEILVDHDGENSVESNGEDNGENYVTDETEPAPSADQNDSGAPSAPPVEVETRTEPVGPLEPAGPPTSEGPTPAGSHEAVPAAAASASTAEVQDEIVRRTNDLRKAQGKPALKTDPRLHSVAQYWSTQQAKVNLMHHNPLMGAQIPAGWTFRGENVAYGQKSAEKVVTAWWNSPGHKANMLHKDFTHIGVGVAYSAKGTPYYTQVFARYPKGLSAPGVFADVSPGAPFYKEIAWMMESGLSTGTSTPAGKAYQPKNSVSREAMAAFLYRLKTPKGASKPAGYTIPGTSPFADVPTNHKFYKEIAWMSASGISTGTAQDSGKPKYDPKTAVSREAIAAFLSRMEQDSSYQAPRTSHFVDVGTNHKFYRQISWMYDIGLSTGVKQASGKPKYQPRAGVTREAMAAFIYRLEH